MMETVHVTESKDILAFRVGKLTTGLLGFKNIITIFGNRFTDDIIYTVLN